MAFPQNVKEEALVSSGRHCCICHKFCGLKIELHHIIQTAEGGENIFENCIPLCFDCHADMRSYDHNHPKGTKYTSSELKRHRNNWYEKISQNFGTGSKENHIADKNLFYKIINILRPQGSIGFIRTNNFAGFGFKLDKLDDFNGITYLMRIEPWNEFFDSDLESLRENLVGNIGKFQNLITTYTFPIKGSDSRSSIPADWEIEYPEKFETAVESIHQTAELIVNGYDNFVRLSRKKLDVEL